MLKIYCSSCGAVHSFALAKPNFCSKCGNGLNPNTINAQKASETLKIHLENVVEDDYEVQSVPDIKNLDVEISINQLKPEKISDIVESSLKNPPAENNDFINITEIDNEKFLENFAQEAGALRPKTREYNHNGKK